MLTRLRLAFTALALVLLVPVGLLVSKAVRSLEAERAVERLAVARRIFDEMERDLTTFLRVEEERPYEHYRQLFLPEGAQQLARSPLAGAPGSTFVKGYFQVEPDGAITTPHEATASEPVAELRAVVARIWADDAARVARSADPGQLPGTTLALDGVASKDAEVDQQDRTEWQVATLDKLNRGATARKQRATKVSQSAAFAAENFYSMDGVLPASDAQQQQLAAPPIDVELEPMVGRLTDSDHLLLYRTVTLGQKAYRQGLLVAIDPLLEELGQRVLAAADLGASARLWRVGRAPARSVPGAARFSHRFADPFGALTAELSLVSYQDLGGAAYVYFLAALLLGTTTLGLYAVYRMVAVTVAFSERRSNFVSAVSHELKTPLTAIRMYGEMLRDGMVESDEKRQRYYGVITAETERLTRLVNNVLELSRLERRPRPLSLVVGDLAPLVEEVVSVMRPHAESEGFSLTIDAAEDLAPVRCDADALKQIVFNLVDNALKYAREASDKSVTLHIERRGDRVALSVADRGPGVPARHLRHVFEPFYRGESELTRRSKGSGIGLALVRGLAERMGASVSGGNRAGGGFEVSVLLQTAG